MRTAHRLALLTIDRDILDNLPRGRWQTTAEVAGRLAALGRWVSADRAKVAERLDRLHQAGLVELMDSGGDLSWRLASPREAA